MTKTLVVILACVLGSADVHAAGFDINCPSGTHKARTGAEVSCAPDSSSSGSSSDGGKGGSSNGCHQEREHSRGNHFVTVCNGAVVGAPSGSGG